MGLARLISPSQLTNSQRQDVVDEHAEAVRRGADAAHRCEAADRDVAVVADDRKPQAELGEVVVDQRADRAALHRGREALPRRRRGSGPCPA